MNKDQYGGRRCLRGVTWNNPCDGQAVALQPVLVQRRHQAACRKYYVFLRPIGNFCVLTLPILTQDMPDSPLPDTHPRRVDIINSKGDSIRSKGDSISSRGGSIRSRGGSIRSRGPTPLLPACTLPSPAQLAPLHTSSTRSTSHTTSTSNPMALSPSVSSSMPSAQRTVTHTLAWMLSHRLP